ncbi:MAG: ribonuclease H-like domain-containing protein [Lachnospiraceae bacterium]
MKIIKTDLPLLTCTYPISSVLPLEKTIFLDIETTGFSAKNSNLYLIGCIYCKESRYHLIQWFASSYEEEPVILQAFFTFIKGYTHLVHFNGNQFDIPYLVQKAAQYKLSHSLDTFTALDLYKRIAPYRSVLKLPDCKQKTIEIFLNVDRNDLCLGGELISVYQHYVCFPQEDALQILLLHNADDVQGLVALLPILAYCDLFNEELRVTKVQANHYTDINGNVKQELLMHLQLPTPLPVTISFGVSNCYFTGLGNTGSLRIPVFEEEMKYFYANYRDYYYLPEEDTAMHKSVAKFVDREHRIQASASTCYTRKIASYLPQWDTLFEPFFKREYNSKDLFFELTDEFKKKRSAFSQYASHILRMMVKYS